MVDYTNRLERLSYVLSELSRGVGISTPVLAEKLSVSKKIIQTDFNTYILPFIDDVYYDASSKCYLTRGDFLQVSLLSSVELATMLMVKVKCSDNYSPEGLLASVDNLFNSYNTHLEESMYAKAMVESIGTSDDRLRIENAIESCTVIHCRYNDKDRELYPLSIINLEGFWYLVNWDIAHKDIRRYHLKSITDVLLTEVSFTRSPQMNEIVERFAYAINAFFEPYVEPYAVELYVDAKVARYFVRMPLNKRQRVMTTYADGSMDIEIFITDDMELIPTIQRYIPYVRVIEPERLREKIFNNTNQYRELII